MGRILRPSGLYPSAKMNIICASISAMGRGTIPELEGGTDAMKQVIVEFHGGERDGESFNTTSTDWDESLFAMSNYLMTRHGRIGARLCVAQRDTVRAILGHAPADDFPDRDRPYLYEVADRQDDGETIRVDCRHVAIADCAA